MDDAEEIAEKYLTSLSIGEVIHEPDGNVPPDFLLGGRIAVEVRRLYQHEEGGRGRSLQETQIPLVDGIRGLLASLGPPSDGMSWFAMFKFERPVPSWARLRSQLRDTLLRFKDAPAADTVEIELSERFSITLVCAQEPHEHLFLLGGFADMDSGGWLLSELVRNTQLCVDEKRDKLTRVRSRYPEWWLVLVDYIGYALTDFEREIAGDGLHISHDFDRLILISPLDPTRSIEL